MVHTGETILLFEYTDFPVSADGGCRGMHENESRIRTV